MKFRKKLTEYEKGMVCMLASFMYPIVILLILVRFGILS